MEEFGYNGDILLCYLLMILMGIPWNCKEFYTESDMGMGRNVYP